MKNRGLIMALGCIGALALALLLPVLGVGKDVSLLAFIVAMFACHLLMMRDHAASKKHGKTKGGHGIISD